MPIANDTPADPGNEHPTDSLYAGKGDSRAVAPDLSEHGTAGDDLLFGTDDGRTMFGETGRDTLQGNGGDDTLYGGKGEDTAVFRGNRSDYEVLYDQEKNLFYVHDLVGGRDGHDTLFGVEHLRFADGTIDFAGVHDASNVPTESDRQQLDGVTGAPPPVFVPGDPGAWGEVQIVNWTTVEPDVSMLVSTCTVALNGVAWTDSLPDQP